VAVREAVRIEANADGGRIAFSTAAKDPLASLEIDAAAREITALFDLGETQLAMPYHMLDPDTLASGTWKLDWKGLSFTATARDGDDSIRIDNIGLGDDTSTIVLDDTQLLGVDLNADDGRRLGLTLTADPDGGLPIATFDPGMDLVVDVYLKPLADAGDFVDSWLMDDTYQVSIDGDSPQTQSIAPDLDTGAPGALRVARGTLTIADDSAAVVVPAGQCLLADPVTEGENPIVGAVTAGACP